MSLGIRIVQRLSEVRKRRRMSQAQMGTRLGITEEAYRALEKGRTIRLEWITIHRMMLLLRESGLSLEWFFEIAGPGESPEGRRASTGEPTEPVEDSAQSRLRRALDRASAAAIASAVREGAPAKKPARRAAPAGAVAEIIVLDAESIGRGFQRKTGEVFAPRAPKIRLVRPAPAGSIGLRISGNSLAPDYKDGDVLVCSPGTPAPGKAGLLVLADKSAVLGIWQDDGDSIRFNPLDIDQPIRTPTAEAVQGTFTVERHIPAAAK
jgi:transcriptional regulator with XRE-family HTH domain